MKIVWSPLALERVEEIARYIACDDRAAAQRWLRDIFVTVDRLALFPQSGRIVPELGVPTIREVIFGRYRVIYRIGTQIDIMTVRHGRQALGMDDLEKE